MSPLAAAAYQLLESLEDSQWFSPQQLELLQAEQLLSLVRHAQQTVPFYQTRLSKVICSTGPEELLEKWHEIPILTRAELQSVGENIFSQLPLPDHGKSTVVSTSGSTGRPVSVLTNHVLQFYWKVFSIREHLWHQRDFSKVMAVIRDLSDPNAIPPNGIRADTWGLPTHGIIPTGPSFSLGLCHPREQLAWLNRINPHYFLCYPTVLRGVLELVEAHGNIQLTNLIQIRTFGEIVEPQLRDNTQRLLGVPLVDLYSSTEVGNIALQCPMSDNYHIQSESVFVEILNDKNQLCLPGEIGKVVVTQLHNFASPLIRYEIGDFAQVGEKCICGRGLPTLKKIVGRQRNMLVYPNGEKRWPSFTGNDADNLLKIFAKRQFQIIQNSLSEIEIKIVGTVGIFDENSTRNILQKLFGDCFSYHFNYVDQIPRGSRGKYEDFRSLIA